MTSAACNHALSFSLTLCQLTGLSLLQTDLLQREEVLVVHLHLSLLHHSFPAPVGDIHFKVATAGITGRRTPQ